MLGCAIRGCHPGSYGGIGGGIYAASGSRLTLTNSSIVGNTSSGPDAGGVGGGIAAGSGVTLTIRDSEISGNVGLYGGGGVFLRSGGTLVMEDSEVVGNDSSVDGFGGDLLLVNATASITRSTISNNNAEYSGGGVFARGQSGRGYTPNPGPCACEGMPLARAP